MTDTPKCKQPDCPAIMPNFGPSSSVWLCLHDKCGIRIQTRRRDTTVKIAQMVVERKDKRK